MPRFRTNSPLPVGATRPCTNKVQGFTCTFALHPCGVGRVAPTKGFTLLEIVSVIAIIGILGGTIAPLAVQQFTSKRGEVTVDRLEEFKKAIIGNPFVIGDDVRSSFGYLGDMGNLPTSLQDLYIRGTQPTYPPTYNPYTRTGYDPDRKTGAGWRGPYVNPDILEDLATLGLDAYMQQLVYSTTAFTDTPYTGASVVGRLTSTGPNRTQGGNVADDRNVYIFQSEAFATVSGFLKDTAGSGIPGVKVTMNYPVNGSFPLTPLFTTTSITVPYGYFSLPNVPYGNRSVTIEPKLVYAPGSARAGDFYPTTGPNPDTDGIPDDIEFYITNLSNTNIQVEKVIVWFDISTAPSANYRELKIADSTSGTLKDDVGSGNKQSGDAARFNTPPTRVTINGNPGGPSGQSYIVRVQSPQTHIPELKLQNYPAGATAKVQILEFERTGSDPLNVSGIPFKVEFFRNNSDTTAYSTIYITPNVN